MEEEKDYPPLDDASEWMNIGELDDEELDEDEGEELNEC